MAILAERSPQLRGFGDFGYNEDYCDRTYPRTSPQLIDWNNRCKKGCSGFECITNPGAAADPWTVLGKNARGLPDDSLLGSALNVGKSFIPGKAKGGGGGGGGGPPPGSITAKATDFLTSPIGIAVGGVAIVGLVFALKAQRKGRR